MHRLAIPLIALFITGGPPVASGSAPTADAAIVEEAAPAGEAVPSREPAVVLGQVPRLSPFDPTLVSSLRAIRRRNPRRQDNVFMKVGDSSTVSRGFLECLASDDELDLGGRDRLRPTLTFFRAGRAGRRDPFRRDSLAAAEGWSTRHVLTGSPPPLLAEVRVAQPRFALVMNGGNDVQGGDDYRYARRMLRIVRLLRQNGVIPILNSLPPRADSASANRLVQRFNGISWAIARAFALPYLDYHQVMAALPRQGLAGDGVHPNARMVGARAHACDFSREGLEFGHNARNLLALEALDRLRRTVVEEEDPPDPPRPATRGEGTLGDPRVVSELPFAELGDTLAGGADRIDVYACAPDSPETGREIVYRLDVEAPFRLRVRTVPVGDADVDIHLLRGAASADRCVARGDREIEADLAAGTWFVSIDTFGEDGAERAGPFVVLLERAP